MSPTIQKYDGRYLVLKIFQRIKTLMGITKGHWRFLLELLLAWQD